MGLQHAAGMQPQSVPVDAVGGVERLDEDSATEATLLSWIAGQGPGDVGVSAAVHPGRSRGWAGVASSSARQKMLVLDVVSRERREALVEFGGRPRSLSRTSGACRYRQEAGYVFVRDRSLTSSLLHAICVEAFDSACLLLGLLAEL